MKAEPTPSIDIDVLNKNVPKSHLKDSFVTNNKVSLQKCLNGLRYTWCVGSYCELQNGVMYQHSVEKAYHSCTFKLEKRTRYLILRGVVSGNLVENGSVQVYIKISDRKPSDSKDMVTSHPLNSEIAAELAAEVTKDKFILTFPSQTLATRYERQKVPLYVIYYFLSRPRSKPLPFWNASIDKKSATEVCEHISSDKNSSLFFDFSIIVRKRVFTAHRCVLAVRSRYFSDFFKSQGEVRQLEIDMLPGIVWYVLRYMYAGQMDALDITVMIQILQLARRWEIYTLVESCLEYLRGKIELHDMKKAVDLGLEVECLELSKVTERLEKLKLDEDSKEN